MNQVYGLDEVELRSFSNKIQQVTLSQVNQAARELLHPDKIVVVTASLLCWQIILFSKEWVNGEKGKG